jgi:hypothetical protein
MSIIENHILSIVNNNDGISAFCDSIWDDYDFSGYIAEIEMNNNYTLNSYQYDYNICKYEIMNEIYGDVAQEQFYNNTISVLVKDITDADKHIMFKFLITEAKKSFGNAVGNLVDDYVEDNWQSIISSYVLEKVNRMILDEDDWIQYSIINRIEDEVRDRLRAQVIREIAINKIKRNKIFNLGLGLKLSMRDCGVTLGA